MERVLITGGSGLIGLQLAKYLQSKGYKTRLLSRNKELLNGYDEVFRWNPAKLFLEEGALQEIDYIVHLAGAGIADSRWTSNRRKEILLSRTQPIELLLTELIKQRIKIKGFIGGSAIGWYGAVTDEQIHQESESAFSDFMGETCRLWEAESDRMGIVSNRVVKVRTGVVLSMKGGALPKIVAPFKFGVGSAIGSGKQYIPWIHIEDICRVFHHAITESAISGPLNAVAPEHITNAGFTKQVAEVLGKHVFPIHVPSIALRIALGEMSKVVTEGSRVSSDKLIQSNFSFNFPGLKGALMNLLAEPKTPH